MIKISKVEAYQSFNETDFSVMEDELYLCASSDQRGDREQKQQFFLLDETTIILEIYWNDEKVHTVAFENKAELTEQGKKRLGEQKKEVTVINKQQVNEEISSLGKAPYMSGSEFDCTVLAMINKREEDSIVKVLKAFELGRRSVIREGRAKRKEGIVNVK